jgi:hypothetical protein
MTNLKMCRRKQPEPNRRTIPYSPKQTEGKSVRIAGIPARCSNLIPPNINVESFHYINLLGKKKIGEEMEARRKRWRKGVSRRQKRRK